MTTNTIAIGKDTILRDVLSWLDSNKSLLTGCSEEKIAKLAQKHIPGFTIKKLAQYISEAVWEQASWEEMYSPEGGEEEYPILRICKGNIFCLNREGIVVKYHVNSRMKLDIHPVLLELCEQRWKSTCTAINEGDTIEAVCKKFLAIRRKPPKLRQVDEFERFALSFTTDYGSEPGYELDDKIDWITCNVTLGTQYGEQTPSIIKQFRQGIDKKVVESIKKTVHLPDKDFHDFYLKSRTLWGGYLLQYTLLRRQ